MSKGAVCDRSAAAEKSARAMALRVTFFYCRLLRAPGHVVLQYGELFHVGVMFFLVLEQA